ncbi:hypothetical protein N0V90_011870 [Kalmusia sp. IMI 367209]|nr:hypothetical protein N0V90_011870 [Kalmusia sp. IMI 367209]
MRTDTPHIHVAQFMRNAIIRPGLPAQWLFSISEPLTFVALLFYIAFIFLKHVITKMQNRNDAPFPFMELPPELRDMVYENLLEDPHFPPPRPCPQNRGPSWLPSLPQIGSSDSSNMGHKSNFLFLANKQIYDEYMDLMCKKTTFHLTVAPHNYTPPATPAEESKKIWQISPQVLKHMRRCDIKLVTTSTMLGVSDPRNMKPEEWALARQMRRELSEVQNVSELNLHVKAIGDPLWNPLWVWYHATQSLKMMGSASEDSSPSGPKFNRIAFSLDMWSPGENYLKRDPDNGNQWAWWCLKGHCVGPVGDAELTVREFCKKLYDCSTCQPQEDDNEEE